MDSGFTWELPGALCALSSDPEAEVLEWSDGRPLPPVGLRGRQTQGGERSGSPKPSPPGSSLPSRFSLT